MTTFSETWLAYVWAMLWQSTLVMLAVWFLYALSWKRSAAIRYALLSLILIKFLLPTSLHSVTGLGHWFGSLDWRSTPQAFSIAQLDPSPLYEYDEQVPNASALPPDQPSNEPLAVHASESKTHLPTLLFSSWAVGVLFLATLLFAHALRIRKRFSTGTQVTDPATLAILEDCRVKMGVSKTIPLYQLERLSSPVLAGLFRPRILISRATLERLTESHLRPIFLHELAHAKRRDLWVNTLQIVLQVLWFFHPGLWFTNFLLRRERERACDDLVLANLEGASRDYADSILRVLKESASPRFATVGLLGIAERGAAVKGRIRRILDSKRKIRVRIGVLGAVALLVLGAVLLPMAKGETEKPPSAHQLLDKLPEIRSLTYSLTSKLWVDGKVHPPARVMWTDAGHIRLAFPDFTTITDLNQGKGITLNAGQEFAIIESRELKPEYGNLRSFLESALNGTEEYLGAKDVDGIVWDGFRCSEVDDTWFEVSDATVTFWLNRKTGAPVWVEESFDLIDRFGKFRETQVETFTDIVINPDLDLSLFSMEIPEGYTIEDRTKPPYTAKKDDEDHAPARLSEEPLSATETLAKVEYALLAFRSDWSRFPERLDQLTDGIFYLPTVPMDPNLPGLPLNYSVDKKGQLCQVYSVGEDGEDNGGDPTKDLVVSLGPDSKLPPANCPPEKAREDSSSPAGEETEARRKRMEKIIEDSQARFHDVQPLSPRTTGRVDFFGKVSRLTFGSSSLEEVVDQFGEPKSYIWEGWIFKKKNLPGDYIAKFEDGVDVWIRNDRLVEVRFYEPNFTLFPNSVRVGWKLDQVIAALGKPKRTEVGGMNQFEKGILYKEIGGRKGHHYYEPLDYPIRMFFSGDAVKALYVTGNDPRFVALYNAEQLFYSEKYEQVFASGKYEMAIKAFQNIADRYPDWNYSAHALMRIGYCYEIMRNLEDAIKAWEVAVQRFPDLKGFSEVTYFKLGWAYESVGKPEEGLKAMLKASELCDKDSSGRQLYEKIQLSIEQLRRRVNQPNGISGKGDSNSPVNKGTGPRLGSGF